MVGVVSKAGSHRRTLMFRQAWYDLQTGLLECSCRRGSKPRHQDAVHVLGECAFSKPVRGQVVEDMSTVVAEEGQDSDTLDPHP